MDIFITEHARKRLKERTKFSLNRLNAIVKKIYYTGKTIEDFSDNKEKQQYLKNVFINSKGDNLRVFGNDIYIYGNFSLITVFSFPKTLKK